jgi:hypothetical protein
MLLLCSPLKLLCLLPCLLPFLELIDFSEAFAGFAGSSAYIDDVGLDVVHPIAKEEAQDCGKDKLLRSGTVA